MGVLIDATRLFRLVLDDARRQEDQADRAEAAARVRTCIARSGLTAAAFAREIGTSASRLSTYARGTVTPSAETDRAALSGATT